MKKIILSFAFIFLAIASKAKLSNNETLYPSFINSPPQIDGVLNEELYQNIKSVNNFKTFVPDYGKDASEETVAYMAYDENNLYFAFKCYDKEPEKIKASVTSRDNIRNEDWICINLDSFNDKQSLTSFYVNPYGIQMDSRFMGGNEDTSIDLIWYSAGKITHEGYIIEMQIPLKSIRYSNTKPVVMGIFFERKISRRSEQVSYPELDPDKGFALLTQLSTLEYKNLKKQTLLEVLPAFTYSHRDSYREGSLKNDNKKADGHITFKYGITSDLVLDATYNPDFSQIEADAGQIDINLRNSLYFSEKRPFFLEGNEIYKVASTLTTSNDPLRSIVHTRTIVNPLFGVKLSGKIGKKNLVSVLYAKDELNSGENDFAHFPIFRYKRAIKDDSYIGGIFASRETSDYHNRVSGVDGEVRLTKSSTITFHHILSEIKKENTFTNGHTSGIKYEISNRNIDFAVNFKDISNDFNVDMGYIKRTGIQLFSAYFNQKIYPQNEFFRKLEFQNYVSVVNDKFHDMWETFNYSAFIADFGGSAQFIAKYYLTTEIYRGIRFKTNGFHTLLSNQFSKALSGYYVLRWNNAILYGEEPQQGRTFRATVNVVYKPSNKITSELSFNYAQFRKNIDEKLAYTYPLTRFKLTYQLNKYLFIRGITEYNGYSDILSTDFLTSFTYIPGTVVHFGYGSVYKKYEWDDFHEVNRESNRFIEHNRGFFFKVSYLFRI